MQTCWCVWQPAYKNNISTKCSHLDLFISNCLNHPLLKEWCNEYSWDMFLIPCLRLSTTMVIACVCMWNLLVNMVTQKFHGGFTSCLMCELVLSRSYLFIAPWSYRVLFSVKIKCHMRAKEVKVLEFCNFAPDSSLLKLF